MQSLGYEYRIIMWVSSARAKSVWEILFVCLGINVGLPAELDCEVKFLKNCNVVEVGPFKMYE
jgi:hypothetical protein